MISMNNGDYKSNLINYFYFDVVELSRKFVLEHKNIKVENFPEYRNEFIIVPGY